MLSFAFLLFCSGFFLWGLSCFMAVLIRHKP